MTIKLRFPSPRKHIAAALIAAAIAATAQAEIKGEIQSLAVLPLANLTGDASLDWLSVALQDSLTVDLWNVPAVQTLAFPQFNKNVADFCPGMRVACVAALDGRRAWNIAQKTSADRYLGGSYRKHGDHIEVVLTEKITADNALKGETRFAAPLSHLLAASSQALLRRLAAEKLPVTSAAKNRILAPKTTSLEAWRLNAEGYLLQQGFDGAGRYQEADRPLDLPSLRVATGASDEQIKARQADIMARWQAALEQAVAADPKYAEAWNNLGYRLGWHRREESAGLSASAFSRPAFEKALSLKPQLIDALIGMAQSSEGGARLDYVRQAAELNGAIEPHVKFLGRSIAKEFQSLTAAGRKDAAEQFSERWAQWLKNFPGQPELRFSVGFNLAIEFKDTNPTLARRMLTVLETAPGKVSADFEMLMLVVLVGLDLQESNTDTFQARATRGMALLPHVDDASVAAMVGQFFGLTYIAMSNKAEASKVVAQAVARIDAIRGTTPDTLIKARRDLLAVLAQSGDHATRALLARKNVELRPHDLELRSELVDALFEGGQGTQAAAYLAELIKRDTASAAARLDHESLLATLHRAMGNKVAEREALQQFVADVDAVEAAAPALAAPFAARRTQSRQWLAEAAVAAGQGAEALALAEKLEAEARKGLPKTRATLLSALEIKLAARRLDGAEAELAARRELIAESRPWLENDMQKNYFWQDNLGRDIPAQADSMQALLDSMTYKERDHWSYIASATDAARAAKGEYAGLGMDMSPDSKKRLRVSMVNANSPAAAAGIRRGDIIEAVGGRDLKDILANKLWSTAWGPSREGVEVKLSLVTREGEPREVNTRKAIVKTKGVPLVKVIDSHGHRVGYMQVNSFLGLTEDEVRESIAALRAQKAEELVLDLRYNGGGRVDLSNLLASGIAGNKVAGQVYSKIVYNEKNTKANSTDAFRGFPGALNLKRLVVLTTQDTCSASEALINGLRPFIEVITVGDRSCGKPVGMASRSFGPWQLSAINFEITNGKGEGRYFEGIKATCPMVDDLDHDLGDPAEGMFQEGLTYLRDGQCSGFVMRAPPSRREEVIGVGKTGLALELGAF